MRQPTNSTGPLPLVGAGAEVPLVTGEHRRYVNLDIAASAPALQEVHDAVQALLPWYSSVHRGAGFKSMVCTQAYEEARTTVRRFVGGRPDDTVIFTRNTTDALNLLAAALPADGIVVMFATEHHANLLPWRRHDVRCLPAPSSAAAAVQDLDRALSAVEAGRPCLVAVTGASNVTGEIWPVAELAQVARRHGARVVVDAAQLAPHRRLDIADLDVDYVALSGHKLYAPYGAGALVGRPDWLAAAAPFLAGGGAVDFVTADDVLWSGLPERHEAGSPNVVGVVALAAACRVLTAVGFDALAGHEAGLVADAERRLAAIPGVELYSLWDRSHPRIGVVTFNLHGYDHALLAAVLSAEHAIGVRHGCFCAHPLMLHLLRLDDDCADAIRRDLREGTRRAVPGAVRASFGVGSTGDDVDRLVEAVARIAADGPRWTYEPTDGGSHFVPYPETRTVPALSSLLDGS